MSPITRRVLQAALYEVVAVCFVGPVLSLAVLLSTIALLLFFFVYAIAFTWAFDRKGASAVLSRTGR